MNPILLIAAAQAGTFYDTDTVAAESKVFNNAAMELGPNTQKAEESLGRYGRAMEMLELGGALAGDRAPDGFANWAAGTKKTVNYQYLQVQAHFDFIAANYEAAFAAAMERALPTIDGGADAELCQNTGGLAGRFGGPGGMGSASSGCDGTDISSNVAAALDEDPKLKSDIATINGTEWPGVGVEHHSWEASGEATHWVSVAAVAKELIKDRLSKRSDSLDMALADFEVGISEGDAEAVKQAERLKAQYLGLLNEDGAALMTALDDSLERGVKKAGLPDTVGYCANPTHLGGCEGEDVTEQALQWFITDPKLSKALRSF